MRYIICCVIQPTYCLLIQQLIVLKHVKAWSAVFLVSRQNTNGCCIWPTLKKKAKMYLRKATQYQPDQFSDVGEGRVTSGVSNVFAADVQHRAQWYSTQCNIITHVEQQAVQVLPQLHGLQSKQDDDQSTRKQWQEHHVPSGMKHIAYFKHQFAAWSRLRTQTQKLKYGNIDL